MELQELNSKRIGWTGFELKSSPVQSNTITAKEKYDVDCCIPKFRGYSSWMIYGSISYGNKGPLVVFEKDWLIELGYKRKTINGDVYRIYICPNIKAFA